MCVKDQNEHMVDEEDPDQEDDEDIAEEEEDDEDDDDDDDEGRTGVYMLRNALVMGRGMNIF